MRWPGLAAGSSAPRGGATERRIRCARTAKALTSTSSSKGLYNAGNMVCPGCRDVARRERPGGGADAVEAVRKRREPARADTAGSHSRQTRRADHDRRIRFADLLALRAFRHGCAAEAEGEMDRQRQ